ncbi:ABC transporter permease [Pseudonocardiaceae bacterium YIM PH 21723]|nr:ABC transporter permease [Pseudonocardiaceae bacterium YIM PH 21723]
MKNWFRSLGTSVRFDLIMHSRNMLAMLMIVGFIPFMLFVVRYMFPTSLVGFMVRATGMQLTVPANAISVITVTVNTVTLVVSFMMFAATRRTGDFDQRLVLAGLSRTALLTGKLLVLALISAVVSGYAALLIPIFQSVQQPWWMWAGLASGAAVYGGIGTVLALVLTNELAGMFAILVVSLLDVAMQNPLVNPSSGAAALKLLPSYGSTQSAVAAAFTDELALRALLGGPGIWFVLCVAIGFGAFAYRTRNHAPQDRVADNPESINTASAVWLIPGEDGSVIVRNTSGAVILCSELAARTGGADATLTPHVHHHAGQIA